MTRSLVRICLGVVLCGVPLGAGTAATPASTSQHSDDLAVTVQLDVQPKGDQPKRAVTPGETLHEGDRISMRVAVEQDAFIYVVQVFPSGDSQTLFPRPGSPDVDHVVPALVQMSIPRNNGFIQLDEETGEESILVVASARPLERITPEQIRQWDRKLQDAGMVGTREVKNVSAEPPAPPPRALRPPPQPIAPNDRGEVLARADGAIILRASGERRAPVIARFKFQHQGTPPHKKQQ